MSDVYDEWLYREEALDRKAREAQDKRASRSAVFKRARERAAAASKHNN